MKALALIMLVLSVGCGKDSKKEKCVFNGQPIPCGQSSNPAIDPDLNPIRGKVLNAKISVAIKINHDSNTIQYLHNAFDSDTAQSGGKVIRCDREVRMTDEVNFSFFGPFAYITDGRKSSKLRRISGNAKSIIGEWQSQESTKGVSRISNFRIQENFMTVQVTCTIL